MYKDGDIWFFMNNEKFEQYAVDKQAVILAAYGAAPGGEKGALLHREGIAHAARVRSHQVEVEAHNVDIVAWQAARRAIARASNGSWSAVDQRVPLPQDLPRVAEIAYLPRAEQVVVQIELPGTDVVSPVARYSYCISCSRTSGARQPG